MRKGYGGILQKDHWKGCKLTTSLPVTLLDTLCSVELIKRKTPPWIVLIWSTLHDDRSIFGLPSTQTVLLLSVFPSRSLPDRPFSSKECKNRGFQPQASFHSRRIPVDTGQPFTVTWKVVKAEKMLFEDCLVCHDPPSARITPSKENLPPPCRSTAGWARAFAESKFETMHASYARVDLRLAYRGLLELVCFAARSAGCSKGALKKICTNSHRDKKKFFLWLLVQFFLTPPFRLLQPSLQQAGRTWHREMADQMCMVIDRPRPRSAYSAGAGEEVSPFCTSLLWLRHFSLSAQVRCCCRREWQS